ncbi:hypothetical protein [Streptomyces sp. NPDC048521]|uniref:hypothetical protein n=1 Tax=Streptomyces sp. NPDC048521 TaxID=3365566 RepID=UPI003710BB8A
MALPPVVTFATGADLLVRLGLAKNMTREGVRRLSKHPDWPFGPDRPYPYWPLANAEVMETGPFLEFFRKHPIVGRGPDREPGRRGKASKQQ